MAQYAILLYSPAPADPMEVPPDELQAQIDYGGVIEELGGKISSPQALAPSTTATSIRGDVITDGPFIESKEVLAGFFVLDARDLDHALEIAKRCPGTWRGGVEVRPLFTPPED
jgi:hypothetical protein